MNWKTKILFLGGILGLFSLYGCSSVTPTNEQNITLVEATVTNTEQNIPLIEATVTSSETPIVTSRIVPNAADVISVDVRGEERAYQFSVEISSPDEGCNQYADWWEVVDEEGELIYRRILLHSHVGEQPFTRSGGPVQIEPDAIVWVRSHMHPTGYGGAAMKGSVAEGFVGAELGLDFAPELAESSPLPGGCDF
jgi:hypothetical protein